MDPKIQSFRWYYIVSIIISLLSLVISFALVGIEGNLSLLLSCLYLPLPFIWFFITIYVLIRLVKLETRALYLSVPIISILDFIYSTFVTFGLFLIMPLEEIEKLIDSYVLSWIWVPIYVIEISLAIYILIHKDSSSKAIPEQQ